MTLKPHRFLPYALAGLVLGGALAACTGAPNSAGSLPAAAPAPAERRAPAPAPTSTEFFAGITANSNPRGIAPGPGGMWFTQPGANEIGRISSIGVVTEFPAPATTLNNIVEGPDGSLWFTQGGADSIGRMTRIGRVRTFTVGNEAYGPWDITVGSDGNLWFTFRSPSTNAIGRITTAGVVTLFTNGLSPGDVAVHDITTGPDGNVWFAEEFGNRIGRITPAGTITEFTNGITANAGLVDITPGPDGNLWFTENSANQIGRITTSGVVTEFSQGITANSGPGSIMNAGNYVWFTELNNTRIGRVSTSGRIVEYPMPAAVAADLAAGAPHNSLWITDYTGNGIVQFTP
jgi:streptogramin lyase